MKAQVGDGNWVADEMYRQGRRLAECLELWNVMDTKTRYILATHLSYRTRTQR